MIDAEIRLDDEPRHSVIDGKRIVFGASRIEVFSSRLIGVAAYVDGNDLHVWAGEGCAARGDVHGAYRTIEQKAAAHRADLDRDAVYVAVSSSTGDRSVVVARSSAGACPIYVAANGPRLVVSWRYEAAVGVLSSVRPDIAACRLFLEKAVTHTRRQIIEGTYILWPGEALRFSASGIVFSELQPLGVARPAMLTTDAHVVDAFIETVAEGCRTVLEPAGSAILKLSGGYDSSCVGLAAVRVRQDLLSYGVVQSGVVGAQQTARRAELVDLLQTRDFTYPVRGLDPFDFPLEEEQHSTCMNDIYRSYSSRVLSALPFEPPELVVTGIGGDELTKEETFRRAPGELKGNCSSSALAGAMCRYDVFLRRGIWVTNPLIRQSVVDFCRALPIELRKDRLLNILTLARSGLSDGFLFPYHAEHFGNNVLGYTLQADFNGMFAESILAISASSTCRTSCVARARRCARDTPSSMPPRSCSCASSRSCCAGIWAPTLPCPPGLRPRSRVLRCGMASGRWEHCTIVSLTPTGTCSRSSWWPTAIRSRLQRSRIGCIG